MRPQDSAFRLLYQPAPHDQPQLLGHSPDANAATVAAHEALWRLRKQGRDGAILLVRDDPAASVVLRLPLVHRPTRRVPTSRPKPSDHASATFHPGWDDRAECAGLLGGDC